MTTGKLASQAGHAFVDTMEDCRNKDSARFNAYSGTKVVLEAANEQELLEIYEHAQKLGLPCTLIIDSGHIMPPHFDGSPILTAIGIGPALRKEVQDLTQYLPLVK